MSELDSRREICRELYRLGHIKTWFRDNPSGWVLVSGVWSPLYVQLRGLGSTRNSLPLFRSVVHELGSMVRQRVPTVSRLVGIAMAGIPLATGASLAADVPFVVTRKLEGVKNTADLPEKLRNYGEHNLVEGTLGDNDVLVMVDDVTTRLDTKLVAREQIMLYAAKAGLTGISCSNVAVVIDREQREEGSGGDLEVFALVKLRSEGLSWLEGEWSKEEAEGIEAYLASPESFQSEKARSSLPGSRA